MHRFANYSMESSLGLCTGILAKLVARALTVTFTLISLLFILAPLEPKHGFNNVFSYRYMLFSTLLGSVYSLLQTLISIFQLVHGTNGTSSNLVPLDFYGDLVILYALVTGAAAGFNVTMDLTRAVQAEGNNNVYDRFLVDKVNAAATFVFLGSICSSISLVLSTFDLRYRCLNSFRCYMMKVKRFFN